MNRRPQDSGSSPAPRDSDADAYLERIHSLPDTEVTGFALLEEFRAPLPRAAILTAELALVKDHTLDAGRQRLLVDDLANLLLTRSGEAVLLLSRDGSVDRANAVARQILARRDGLLLSETRQVTATDPTTHTRLKRAVRSADTVGPDADLTVVDVIPVPREGVRDPYLVSVVCLPRPQLHQTGPHATPIALLLRDPDVVFQDFETALRHVHGLTPMEAKVASGVLEGLSLPELSQRNGVSANTLRTQIKAVFAKMGVHKRSQFVRACYLAARHARQDEPPPVT